MKQDVTEDFSQWATSHPKVISLANVVKTMPQVNIQQQSDLNGAHCVEELIGSSPMMGKVRDLIRQAARSDVTVLITGENGTGKELIAQSLHYAGPRSSKPLVAVNCAAMTETLIESEIFGHERGAFTGATSRRRGKFEQAHGGSIILDEIGDMSLTTQAKMLRVLQERSFQRVGGEDKINVDVRVICATNHNLDAAVHQGTFRMDLLYRVNRMVIEVPPLRERLCDIPELTQRFIAVGISSGEHVARGISEVALSALCAHNWPGNIRELQNAIERALIVCDEDQIQLNHLPPAVLCPSVPIPSQTNENIAAHSLVKAVTEYERAMITAALERSDWNKTRAAVALQVTRRMLSYKMEKLEIE